MSANARTSPLGLKTAGQCDINRVSNLRPLQQTRGIPDEPALLDIKRIALHTEQVPTFDIPLRLLQLVCPSKCYIYIIFSSFLFRFYRSYWLSTRIRLAFSFCHICWELPRAVPYNCGVQDFQEQSFFCFYCWLGSHRMNLEAKEHALLVSDSGHGLSASWAGRAWQEFKDWKHMLWFGLMFNNTGRHTVYHLIFLIFSLVGSLGSHGTLKYHYIRSISRYLQDYSSNLPNVDRYHMTSAWAHDQLHCLVTSRLSFIVAFTCTHC